MALKKKNWPYYAIILALVILLAYIGSSNYENFTPPETAQRDDEINFFIADAKTTQYRPDGTIHYKLESPEVKHREQVQITMLETPVLLVYSKKQVPWWVHSEKATVLPGDQGIVLTGNVTDQQPDDQVEIKTEIFLSVN